MILIDKCAYTNNLAKSNPTIKFIIGMIFLFASMAINNLIILLSIAISMSFVIVGIAKIDIGNYLKLIKIPMYFLIVGIIVNFISISFNSDGFIYSFKIFSLHIGVSIASINSSIYILFRAMACLTCVYFFVLTTPFNQLLMILKKLYIPDTIIELIMLVYRFIFIFLEEVEDIRKSQQLRFGYINIKNSYKSIGLLGNLLYKRLMKRYEDMSISLDMKLYNGKFYIIEDEYV